MEPKKLLIASLAVILVCDVSGLHAATTPCTFSPAAVSYEGTPVEQAACLLRDVWQYGEIGKEPKTLPHPLDSLVGKEVSLAKQKVQAYLDGRGIGTGEIGGSIMDSLSFVHNGNETVFANYFVIHDVSMPNYALRPIPSDINEKSWEGNRLDSWDKKITHVYVNRLGESKTAVDFETPLSATKYEVRKLGDKGNGLFLHIEMIQPRKSDPKGKMNNDAVAPDPGFTEQQYDRLALLYIVASVRRGKWMIPAYHACIDAGIPNGHDDPQRFDLTAWAHAIKKILGEIEIGKGDSVPADLSLIRP